jgi:hypothetical protein
MTDKLEHLIELKLEYEGRARASRGRPRLQYEKLAATYHDMAMAEMKKAVAEATTP